MINTEQHLLDWVNDVSNEQVKNENLEFSEREVLEILESFKNKIFKRDTNQQLPKIVKCSITGLIAINEIGSSIGGGFWETLEHNEVACLNINPSQTQNAKVY